MGRARSHQTEAAVDGFATVLGARRGSASAQAQRDADERACREVQQATDLDNFRTRVGATGPSASVIASDLITAYNHQRPVAATAATLLCRIREINLFERLGMFGGLAATVDVGDPASCPGLTAPVLLALCDYFEKDGVRDPHSSKRYGECIIARIFGTQRAEADYLGLTPLCASLGPLIADPAIDCAASLRYAAAEALGVAPESALAEPLSSWIAALAPHVQGGSSWPGDVRALQELLTKYAPGTAGALALAPLVQRV